MVRSGQMILLGSSQWDPTEATVKFPSTDADRPLYLFNRENNNVAYVKDSTARTIPIDSLSIFPSF